MSTGAGALSTRAKACTALGFGEAQEDVEHFERLLRFVNSDIARRAPHGNRRAPANSRRDFLTQDGEFAVKFLFRPAESRALHAVPLGDHRLDRGGIANLEPGFARMRAGFPLERLQMMQRSGEIGEECRQTVLDLGFGHPMRTRNRRVATQPRDVGMQYALELSEERIGDCTQRVHPGVRTAIRASGIGQQRDSGVRVGLIDSVGTHAGGGMCVGSRVVDG